MATTVNCSWGWPPILSSWALTTSSGTPSNVISSTLPVAISPCQNLPRFVWHATR
jgi:hypothetical protein